MFCSLVLNFAFSAFFNVVLNVGLNHEQGLGLDFEFLWGVKFRGGLFFELNMMGDLVGGEIYKMEPSKLELKCTG